MSHPTVPPNASRFTPTTQSPPSHRDHLTYDVVERIYAIPGVRRVTVNDRYAVAYVEVLTYNRTMLHAFGYSNEDALLTLEQAVRDSYMAVM